MAEHGIDEEIMAVRRQAMQLVAQLNAAPGSAAPLLQAVAALEARLGNAPPPPSRDADTATALHEANAHIARLHQVLMDVPVGICMLHGPEQRYIFTNPSYDHILGRTDLLGRTVREVFPQDVEQGLLEILEQVYHTGQAFAAPEMLVEVAHGSSGLHETAYFDLMYRPLWTADETITGVVAYVQDVSERHLVDEERARMLYLTYEAASAAERERFRLLDVLHQAPAAICTLDGPEHVFSFANPRYEQLVGRQQLVGQPMRMALPELAVQDFFDRLDEVYATGRPFFGSEVAFQMHHAGSAAAETVFLNFVYAPLRDADDLITGVFVHAVDVTELVAARTQAETAVVIRDHFLSIAAHELKTPLTALLGYIQVIHHRLQRTNELDERNDRILHMVAGQGQRLNRLIDTLLDVSRINLGHLSIERIPLDLGALTARVVDEVGITLDRHVLRVELPTEACIVPGDALRLEQVIVNLIQNAIKYSPKLGDILVMVQCTADTAILMVRDHGLGIPATALPHLFERFYRVQDDATEAIPGLGIGLSVVNEIVTLHGGDIVVESSEGVGSTFTVRLPLVNATEAQRNS